MFARTYVSTVALSLCSLSSHVPRRGYICSCSSKGLFVQRCRESVTQTGSGSIIQPMYQRKKQLKVTSFTTLNLSSWQNQLPMKELERTIWIARAQAALNSTIPDKDLLVSRHTTVLYHIHILVCHFVQQARSFAHFFIHTYIHTYIRTYVRTYVHTYIHTCIHPRMHACMHKLMDILRRQTVNCLSYLPYSLPKCSHKSLVPFSADCKR